MGTDPFANFASARHTPEMAARRMPPSGRWYCPMCPGVDSDRPGNCWICGMPLSPPPDALEDTYAQEAAAMLRKFTISALLSAPIVLYGMLHMLGVHSLHHWVESRIAPSAANYIQLVITIIVIACPGRDFMLRGFRGVAIGRFNMFTLVMLGVLSAFAYSAMATITPGLIPGAFKSDGVVHVYYESAVSIICIVMLGEWMEARARGRASGAVRELLKLRPDKAHKLVHGAESDVSADEVGPGDLLRVRPGERIPADGNIIEGLSIIDESTITGEPIPRDRGPGDVVTAGTVNLSGSFIFQATRTGSQTTLSRIVHLVASAQRTRAPISRLADKVTQWFVPAVVLVAAITFIVWLSIGPAPKLAFAVINAVSVLMIACPCAMGLATPMALSVAMGRAARLGTVVRDAAAIEAAERTTVVFVDKTGTLTEGRPTVVNIFPAEGSSTERILALAAAVEEPSEHPLARAIVDCARGRGIAIPVANNFNYSVGSGAAATVDGCIARIGRREFAAAGGATFEMHAPELNADIERGCTMLYVAFDNRPLGAIAIADTIRPGAAAALEQIRSFGARIIMLTGDEEPAARHVSKQLGIDEFHYAINPATKAEIIQQFRSRGETTLMAGDGVNDAPALASAHVGVAMGGGSDLAMETAPVTLIRGDLGALGRFLNLSRATMRVVRQNLFWAFIYNAAGVPMAAGLGVAVAHYAGAPAPLLFTIPPAWSAVAMVMSDVIVVGNSARLRNIAIK